MCLQLDVGSDSESGAPNHGVSGPGQSNLSNEVAAALLIQSEMASNRRRRTQAVPPSGRDSPDMDFLEMDFDPGESDEDFVMPPERLRQDFDSHLRPLDDAGRAAAVVDSDALDTEGAAASPIVLSNFTVEKTERPNYLAAIENDTFDGIASAPLQSPAEHIGNCNLVDNSLSCMVRSQSLNSPLARQQFISRLEPCMVRGESDPGGGGPRNKRRHSGEGGALCHSSSSSSGIKLSLIL